MQATSIVNPGEQTHFYRRAEDAQAARIAECEKALCIAAEAETDLEVRYAGNFQITEMRAVRETRRQAVDALRKARQG